MVYVSHVDDKCEWAANRLNQYNTGGLPTAFFDGGYKVKVGAYTNVNQQKNYYMQGINPSGNRAVPALDLDLNLEWVGGAELRATATVVNNSGALYEGTLRVYVTELVSSLNWRDTGNKLYKFPHLDSVFTETLNIPDGDTWTQTVTWDGATKNSGNPTPQSYANIDYDNIALVGAVHNAEWHQGYADPPSSRPFDAYYVDQSGLAYTNKLSCDVYTVSETGGTVNLGVWAGTDQVLRKYLIVGGMTGASPGTTLPGGLVLPVNWDAFTDNVFFPLLNTPVFSNFYGTLGVDGSATAQLNLPALPAGYVGSVLTFAYCMRNPWDFVSNSVEIEIVP